MMGMPLLQGLDFGVAQGGDILHQVCSLRIGWIKAHWDTSMGRTQSSGAILLHIRLDFIPKLMSWYLAAAWRRRVRRRCSSWANSAVALSSIQPAPATNSWQ